MKEVIIYGTYDLFHIGHVRLLKRLSELGDHLTVCISTDEFNAIKGKSSIIPFEQRAEIVAACKYVDAVLPENGWDQKKSDIIDNHISVFAMGDDWAGRFDDLSELCSVVYLSRTEDISTTSLKSYMTNLQYDRVVAIKHIADNLIEKIKEL